MKTIIKLTAVSLLLPASIILTPSKAVSQTVVKIGQAEIAVQSPISFRKKDSIERVSNYNHQESGVTVKKTKYPRSFEDFHIGISIGNSSIPDALRNSS